MSTLGWIAFNFSWLIVFITSFSFKQCQAINQAACDIAFEVANEGDALVCGGVCQTPTYLSGKGKEACQEEFMKQIEIFLKNDVDFLLAEVSSSISTSMFMRRPLISL